MQADRKSTKVKGKQRASSPPSSDEDYESSKSTDRPGAVVSAAQRSTQDKEARARGLPPPYSGQAPDAPPQGPSATRHMSLVREGSSLPQQTQMRRAVTHLDLPAQTVAADLVANDDAQRESGINKDVHSSKQQLTWTRSRSRPRIWTLTSTKDHRKTPRHRNCSQCKTRACLSESRKICQ